MEFNNIPLLITASIALISFIYTIVNHSKNSFKKEFEEYQSVLVYFYLELMNIYTGKENEKYNKAKKLIDNVFEKDINVSLLINQYPMILELKKTFVKDAFIKDFDDLAVSLEELYWEWYFDNQLENVVSQKWHNKVKYKFQWFFIKISSLLKFSIIGFYVGFLMAIAGLIKLIYLNYIGSSLTEIQDYIGNAVLIGGTSILLSSIGTLIRVGTEKNLRAKYTKEEFTVYIANQIDNKKEKLKQEKLELTV